MTVSQQMKVNFFFEEGTPFPSLFRNALWAAGGPDLYLIYIY